ncbi:MAG: hypothetical protein KJZ80_19240 [Hyphomicrobiaceae bacterium]|nr:hypothetical protein [Hyphomicrobiaceae bacterium]
MFVWAPKNGFEANGRAAFWLVLGFLAVAVLSLAAAAFAAGRGIQEPARRVLAAAQALGEGKPVSFKRTQMGEANVLGAALVEAAGRIATREKALREPEQHTRLLPRELSHRSKNLLAVIEAMARQSDRSSSNRAEFLEHFSAHRQPGAIA